MNHRTGSPTGYRLRPVSRAEGEYSHRIGCLDDLKPRLGLKPDDGYTVCLMLDTSDPRLCLKGGAPSIPILFRFDCGWGGDPLICRLGSDATLNILAEPWGEVIGSPSPGHPEWWPPHGDHGLRFEPIPQRLHDILAQVTGSWYGFKDDMLREWAARPAAGLKGLAADPAQQSADYVDDLMFGPGDAFHHVGGLPAWIQEPIRARCPSCRRVMPFLLSLDSDTALGWCFGDAGRLYAFYCAPCCVLASYAQCT